MPRRPLVELEKVADFLSGCTPSRGEPAYWEGGHVPWISGKDFKSFRIHDSQEHLTERGKTKATTAPEGSTLILVRGMMLARRVPVAFVEHPVAFNQDVRAIIPRDGVNVNPEFLAYAIHARAPALKSFVTYAGHGTGRLETDYIRALPLWIPGRGEQDTIVSHMRNFDDAVASQGNQISTRRDRLRGLTQQLFTGRLRLPGFANEPWDDVRLGEIFKNRREPGREGLSTLSVTMNDGVVDRDTIDRKMSNGLPVKGHLLIHPGDIVYNTMRMWQGASGCAAEFGLVSPAYVVLEPTPAIDPLFASYWFKTERMIYLFWAYSYGLTGDRLRLYHKDFSIIPARIPRSIAEQRAIAEVLDTARREIDLLEQLREQTQTQRRGLMHRLLTGQIRVHVTDGITQ